MTSGERRLAGRVGLVTGAAGALGAAISARLAAEGADVAVSDHPGASDELEAVRATCAASGVRVVAHPLDVTDEAAVDAAVGELTQELGPIDVVVTAAGVQGPIVPVTDQTADEVRAVLDVNLVGTLTVLRACAAALIGAGRAGSIVTMASMAGVSAPPNMAAYAASKAAVIGLTRTAATDLAPHGIRVNAVSPAFIGNGPMWDRQVHLQAAAPSHAYADTPEEVSAQMIASVPMGRTGTSDEVAAVVAFLASDDASYVTGTNTPITGGSR